MKKLILTTYALLVSVSATLAQIPAGTKLRIYNPGFNHSINQLNRPADLYGQTKTWMGLGYGRFVKDNVARGWIIRPELGTSFDRSADETFWYPKLEIGYFNRRYLSITPDLYLFGEGKIGVSSQQSILPKGMRTSDSKIQNYTALAQANFGVTYFLKNGWALESSANLGNLSVNHSRQNDHTQSTTIQLNSSLYAQKFQVGLSKYIDYNPAKSVFTKETPYQPGQTFIGGNVSFLNTSYTYANLSNEYTSNAQSLNLGFSKGKFVTSTHARGFGFSALFNTSKYSSADTSFQNYQNFGLSANVFHEHYLALSPKFSVVAITSLNAYYSSVKTNTSTSRYNDHTLALSPDFSPAIQYQFSPRWSILARVGSFTVGSLGVTLRDYKVSGSDNDLSAALSFNPSYTIGNSGVSLRYFPGR